MIGWFTPDYRLLAEQFAANLDHHGASFRLWAKPKLAPGWNTSRKPSVVLEALDAYPDKTVDVSTDAPNADTSGPIC